MDILAAACMAFFLTHLGISGTPLRSFLHGRLGGNAYLGIYSVVSFLTLGLMIYGYSEARLENDFMFVNPSLFILSKVLVFVALLLILVGLMTPNPTAVKGEDALDDGITGILKVTRHPIQWGIFLFVTAHLTANGDKASLLLFGTVAIVSLVGMFSMDARRRKETDPRWQNFMAETSMIPFAAIFAGRQKLMLADIKWLGLLVGAIVYTLVYYLHGWVSGGVNLI